MNSSDKIRKKNKRDSVTAPQLGSLSSRETYRVVLWHTAYTVNIWRGFCRFPVDWLAAFWHLFFCFSFCSQFASIILEFWFRMKSFSTSREPLWCKYHGTGLVCSLKPYGRGQVWGPQWTWPGEEGHGGCWESEWRDWGLWHCICTQNTWVACNAP